MHRSIVTYIEYLAEKRRAPLTYKAVRGDLIGFAAACATLNRALSWLRASLAGRSKAA